MIYRRCIRTFLIFAGLLCWPAIRSHAQQLTLYAGWENPGHLTLENVQSGLKGSGVYGIRFETDFIRIIGMEHTFGYSPDFVRPEIFSSTGGSRALIYNSNVILNAPLGRLVPYATAGLGLMTSNRFFALPTPFPLAATALGTKFGNHFAVNYGGGVKMVRLLGPLGVRFDVRGYTMPDVFSQSLNLFEVTGGLHFSFGGR